MSYTGPECHSRSDEHGNTLTDALALVTRRSQCSTGAACLRGRGGGVGSAVLDGSTSFAYEYSAGGSLKSGNNNLQRGPHMHILLCEMRLVKLLRKSLHRASIETENGAPHSTASPPKPPALRGPDSSPSQQTQ